MKVTTTNDPDWFTANRSKLMRLIDERNDLFAKQRKGGDKTAEIELRKIRANLKEEIEKSRHFFCRETAATATTRDKLIKGLSHHHEKPPNLLFKNKEGEIPMNLKQSAGNVKKHFDNVCNPSAEIDEDASKDLSDCQTTHELGNRPSKEDAE